MRAFEVVETTIREIGLALASRTLSAVELVELYVDRIQAYDKDGPCLNSVITISATAADEAARLDRRLRSGGPVGPLHGVPVMLKDQVDSVGMPTTLGSVLFKDYSPRRDAFAVARLKRAGAIVLGK
ncbi:MAG: amidase, partial [Candidatus Rokubacteria bacterium]|nr:amidase [Candidatus Rokubacteria bacterium]